MYNLCFNVELFLIEILKYYKLIKISKIQNFTYYVLNVYTIILFNKRAGYPVNHRGSGIRRKPCTI